MEKFFHLSLGLIQLLQDAFNVIDGTVMGGLVAGDGRVPETKTKSNKVGFIKGWNILKTPATSHAC